MSFRLLAADILLALSDRLRISAGGLSLRVQLSRTERYFKVIEDIQTERNQWQKLYQEQGRAHASAQHQMEEGLAKQQQMVTRAVNVIDALKRELNGMRKEKGLDAYPMMGKPLDVAAGLIGLAKQFEGLLAELDARAPATTDGVVEREKIAVS